VYVGSNDDKVYCLDASTGTFIWSYTTGGGTDSSPAVADGRVFVGSSDSRMYCLNATTGALIGTYLTGSSLLLSSPVVAGWRVYVGGNSKNKVYCLLIASFSSEPIPFDDGTFTIVMFLGVAGLVALLLKKHISKP